MNDLISIIIPVYNTDKFLKQCLDSIINQTYKNIEIIVVNDGSTDDSLTICNSYDDSRFKIISQNNMGVSSARNVGLKICKGKYICFVDSDDYVEDDYVEFLYDNILKNGSDISACAFDYVSLNKVKSNIYKSNYEIMLDGYQALNTMCNLNDSFSTIVMNKLFKKSILDGIYFEDGKYFEDIMFNAKALNNTNKIIYVKKVKYHYWISRNDSTMNLPFSKREYDRILSCDQLLNFISKEYGEINLIFYQFYIANLFDMINKMIDANDIDRDIIAKNKKYCQKYLLKSLFSQYGLSRKINMLTLTISEACYIKYYHIKKRLKR